MGIISATNDLVDMKKWFSDEGDVRFAPLINQEILAFVDAHQIENVAMFERIIGYPHEEGIDYSEGKACPHCPFWRGRDRWTGEMID